MNEALTYQVLQSSLDAGIREFVLCPGSRNCSFVQALRNESTITSYYMFEERSAAFFAVGRIKATERPVAVITTSGTAVAELLAATMEAYYSGLPLLLITADRPLHFRGTGAPQSAEQLGIFGIYTPFLLDLVAGDTCHLSQWDQKAPAHLNVCLAEPSSQPSWQGRPLRIDKNACRSSGVVPEKAKSQLDHFLAVVRHPLVIVSTLKPKVREEVVRFLLKFNAPMVLEGISGLREDRRLKPLQVTLSENILKSAAKAGYPVDGVLRIGGVPTQRLWRDLEYLQGKIQVCSINEVPFSGLSWNGEFICTPIDLFLREYSIPQQNFASSALKWIEENRLFSAKIAELFEEEPTAEPSLIYELSCILPEKSQVYLGNSLPIREWDMAASIEDRGFQVTANRGLNGIDGQISTFLGTCKPHAPCWGVFGDLTALYDMAGPWILSQLKDVQAHLIIINNSGGKIFAKMYSEIEMQNCHNLNFEPLAKMWGLSYERWTLIPEGITARGVSRFIEIVPDNIATTRFWETLANECHFLTSYAAER